MKRAAAVLLFFCAIVGLSTNATAQIRIAVAGPMSGSLATLGEQLRDGAAAAIASFNSAGGLFGQELVLEIADDRCSQDRAGAIANQLAGAGVSLVVGHLCSAASIAAAEVYAAESIIQIAPGAPDPSFTDLRPGVGVFRIFGREDDQGPTVAAFLLELPQEVQIAILDDLSVYGGRLADSVVDTIAEAGRPSALVVSYSGANPDFVTLVDRLEAASIGAVFVGGTAQEIADLRLEMERREYRPTLVGGDVLASPDYLAAAGNIADGTLFSSATDPRLSPNSAAAIDAILAIGGNPAGFALNAFAAVEVWVAAAVEAGTTDFSAVASSIAGGTFDTAIGDVSFSANGDLIPPGWAIYQWQNGAVTVYTP
ncbi:MAG: branched-chain amino acid ABC transporter substrate-binding protein [Alphaproteobacteria bacterium]